MKRVTWILGITLLVTYAIYETYFILMPQVKIENISGELVKYVEVTLPSSNLVFGPIAMGSIHTIYYSLDQGDGTYQYRVVYEAGGETAGECGYVTANEIGKSYLFTLRPGLVITCNS